jgi:hypothetical protein
MQKQFKNFCKLWVVISSSTESKDIGLENIQLLI